MAITQHNPLKSTDVSEEHKRRSEKLFACCLLDDGSLLGLFYIPEDGGNMILRGVDIQRTTGHHIPEENFFPLSTVRRTEGNVETF
jgi:hypothetical protein